ncbi:hypothetical protein [Moorena sp. SIO3B2]
MILFAVFGDPIGYFTPNYPWYEVSW